MDVSKLIGQGDKYKQIIQWSKHVNIPVNRVGYNTRSGREQKPIMTENQHIEKRRQCEVFVYLTIFFTREIDST